MRPDQWADGRSGLLSRRLALLCRGAAGLGSSCVVVDRLDDRFRDLDAVGQSVLYHGLALLQHLIPDGCFFLEFRLRVLLWSISDSVVFRPVLEVLWRRHPLCRPCSHWVCIKLRFCLCGYRLNRRSSARRDFQSSVRCLPIRSMQECLHSRSFLVSP